MPDPATTPFRTSPSAPLELSIVMPCLDEARTLETCIRKALRAFEEHEVRGEIVVADNGSSDGSQALARRLGARVVDVAERGYGAALAGGIAAAQGRYVLMADSDDSYDLATVGPFLEQLRQGHELVMGNRFRGGIAPGAMPFLHRHLGNPALTRLARLLFGSPFGDVYCGQRAFSKAAYARLGLESQGMEFALEMVVKSVLFGLKTQEVPVTLSPDGRDRSPHLRTWRDGWRSLRLFLQYSPRWLLVYPGLLLVALGLGGSLLAGQGASPSLGLLACGGAVAAGLHALLLGSIAVAAAPQPVGAPPPSVFARGLEVGLALAAAVAVGAVGLLAAGTAPDPRLVGPLALAGTVAGQAGLTALFLHVLRPRLVARGLVARGLVARGLVARGRLEPSATAPEAARPSAATAREAAPTRTSSRAA